MNKRLIALILAMSMYVTAAATGCSKETIESEVSVTSDTSISESESESESATETESEPTEDTTASATTEDTSASASETVITTVDISKVPESKQLKNLLGKWTHPNLRDLVHQDYFMPGTAYEILSGGQSGTPLDYSIYSDNIKLVGSGYSKSYKMTMDELNWIEENILNLNEEERGLFNESLKAMYVNDSDFERGIVKIPYISSALKIKVNKTLQTDGTYHYANTTVTGYEADEKFTYKLYFTLELKDIDGKQYWSIVNCSMDPFEFDK